MRLGVDYYPEHWPEDRWPEDAALMRAAGIGVVRLAEFAWSRLEPREGNFDLAWLDRAIKILHREGLMVILGTPTAAPPAWLIQKHPDICPQDVRRYRLGFGTRMHRCLNHEAFQQAAARITTAMASAFGKDPAVFGWQLDNEFEANLCYCDICAAKFRAWLAAKYGSLEALNAAWGTVFWSQEYSDWSQIPLPWEAKCGRSHNPSLMLDYRRFASDSTIRFARDQAAIIRHLSPGRFITHNFMGLHDSLDYIALAKELDLASWDNYPLSFLGRQDERTAMAHDVVRGLKQQNFWVMEEQVGITGWEEMGRSLAPRQLRAMAWQAIGRGADAVVFFRWRSCLYGTEQYWHGILGHDGRPGRRYAEVARFGSELARLSPVLDGTTVQNRIAILNSYEQNWAFQIQPQAKGLGFWDQVWRFHSALGRIGINADVVPLTADLSRYAVVIVPGWYIMPAADADKLKDYAKGGGVLVLNPRTGIKNEANVCLTDPLPSLLRPAAGLEIEDYDPLGEATLRVRLENGEEYDATAWAETLCLRGAKSIAVYAEGMYAGQIAAAEHDFGAGKVYYLGFFGGSDFYQTMLTRILSAAGLHGLAGMAEGVDASWRERDGERYLFLVNLSGTAKEAALPPNAEALLGGEPRGERVTLDGFEVGIYRVSCEKAPK